MLQGQIPLPANLHLVTDLQQYQLNWTDRLDKRNPMFSAVCTVDTVTAVMYSVCMPTMTWMPTPLPLPRNQQSGVI